MADGDVVANRLEQCKEEYAAAFARIKELLADLGTYSAEGARSGIDLVATAEGLVDQAFCLERMTERLAREPTLSSRVPMGPARKSAEGAVASTMQALTLVRGIDGPSVEQVRSRAREAGPALWRDQVERLAEFSKRERAIADRTMPQIDELSDIVDFLVKTPDVARHPDVAQKMFDIETLEMSLFEEMTLLDGVLEDLDAEDDLVGIIETVEARRTIVGMREAVANFLNKLPGVTAEHRWGPPPASGSRG